MRGSNKVVMDFIPSNDAKKVITPYRFLSVAM